MKHLHGVPAQPMEVGPSTRQAIWRGGWRGLLRIPLPMRRLLLVFLLVFMPLQSIWAAASPYCGHESAPQASHFGHHVHEHHGDEGADHSVPGAPQYPGRHGLPCLPWNRRRPGAQCQRPGHRGGCGAPAGPGRTRLAACTPHAPRTPQLVRPRLSGEAGAWVAPFLILMMLETCLPWQ